MQIINPDTYIVRPEILNSNNNNSKSSIPSLDFTNEQTELLKLQVFPSTEYALTGVKNELHVLFQLTTLSIERDSAKREPCDLAIVLDRSGSMEGAKLANSKLAIKQVVQNLLPEDKLHFIIYDDKMEVVFENADLTNVAALNQQIDNVTARGSTDIHGGLDTGRKILIKNKKGDGRVQRIFMFSDGLANHGQSKPEQITGLVKDIHTQGITVSSFGIGSDFDESLMRSIAEHGAGDYFFIESAAVLQEFVVLALKGLLGLVGTNAILKIRGANGAVVKKIFGHDDIVKGAHIGDIRQNNMRKVVSTVEFSPKEAEGEIDVVEYSLSYVAPGQKEPTEVKGTLKIKITKDDSLLKTKNVDVEIARITQETAESDLEALNLIDKGKRKEAIALKKKELTKLKEMEHLDKNGFITKMIENESKALTDMETKKDDKEVKKAVHFNHYKHGRNDYAMM